MAECNESAAKPCPSCGRCPTCGRTPPINVLPSWPWYPTYPAYPWYPWGSGTITFTNNSGELPAFSNTAAGQYTQTSGCMQVLQ